MRRLHEGRGRHLLDLRLWQGCFRPIDPSQVAVDWEARDLELVAQDGLHDGFEVVVDHALGHAAEEGEGTVVRVEDHFLGFSGIDHDEHLTAEGQAEMRDLDGQHEAAEFDLLVAPIELADLVGRESQWNEGLCEGRA